MSAFNKDDYLDDLPDADELANGQADPGSKLTEGIEQDAAAEQRSESDANTGAQDGDAQQGAPSSAEEAAQEAQDEPPQADSEDGKLTPLGQAKKEAAEYLEALQRERAEFINYRNRTRKDMDRARQQGIIDVLTAELPALDDIDRIREHGEMDDSFKAVAAKLDKTFEKFGVEKFGVQGEDFDPTKHEAVLHKPDPQAEKATVDTVVEAGYRIGDRIVRAARVVVASPQN